MNRSVGAGQRDRRVEFYAPAVSKTARGAMATGKGPKVASAWARVSYGTAAERRQAGTENASTAATARVPATARTRLINADCVCELDGAAWDVTGTAPYGRREIDITLVRRNS